MLPAFGAPPLPARVASTSQAPPIQRISLQQQSPVATRAPTVGSSSLPVPKPPDESDGSLPVRMKPSHTKDKDVTRLQVRISSLIVHYVLTSPAEGHKDLFRAEGSLTQGEPTQRISSRLRNHTSSISP